MWRQATSVGTGVVLALAVLTPAAEAVRTDAGATTAACNIQLGSVTAAGGHTQTTVVATTPPVVLKTLTTPAVYGAGKVRLSDSFANEQTVNVNRHRYGLVVIDQVLYSSSYHINGAGQIDTTKPRDLVRIGSGWSPYGTLEKAPYARLGGGVVERTTHYAMRTDGTLFRWNARWQLSGTFFGFASVKALALISKTATYDTFLATTRGGRLYTIRIPLTVPARPVVTVVRTATWQRFDALVASRCGQYGTLLLAIDRDTTSAFMYAVGHTNGTATVIKGLGQAPAKYVDPIYFRWTPGPSSDQLNGD
ncbi:hypothetical protein [Kribbella speibonae]|uniref:hypothetical protein n=1 Tax=Kribbella speibonae TaxID=1572660 RepID=UPI001EDDFE8D|nr:hypothetical protein [Kribbella speibonae]